MEITLIRHLPTIWNKYGHFQGKRDIPISFPLDKKTKSQIAKNQVVVNKLKPFDQVFVSELQRTKQTAELYGFQSRVSDPLLNELDFGIYEGTSKQDFWKDFGYVWIDRPLEVELGEKLNDFQRRIIRFLLKYNHLTSLLIFGHGAWIRALLSLEKTGNINDMNKITIKNNEINNVCLSRSQMTAMSELVKK